jgi:heptaprenyl diphosphate synthase
MPPNCDRSDLLWQSPSEAFAGIGMSRVLISPKEIEVGAQLLMWVKTHLMAEEEKIKRPFQQQTVCPFVEASLRKNSLFMVFHSEVIGGEVEPLANLVTSYIDPFIMDCGGIDAANSSKALLIVFPRLDLKHHHTLDVVHALTKSKMIENGLMIGQFHPHCRTPAIHNAEWRSVSVAPYPLIAIRHMVVHDILFLRNRRNWFLHYHTRYGAKYARPHSLGRNNGYLVSIYNEAKRKFLEPASTFSAHTPPP